MKKLLIIPVAALVLAACTAPTLAPVSPAGSSGTSARPAATATGQARSQAPRETPQGSRGSDSSQNSTQKGSEASQSLPLDVPAHPVDVILGRPTDRSITASVLSYQEGEVYIEFGTHTTLPANKTVPHKVSKGELEEIPLEGLQPNTRYWYQVLFRATSSAPFIPLAERSFVTQRSPGTTFTFDVQADSHLDSNSNLDVYARTLANESADRPDFLIDLGDTFMTDKYQPYTVAEKQYLTQRYFLGTLAPSPLFLVLGNHDGEGSSQGEATSEMSALAGQWRTRYFPNPLPNAFYMGNATPDPTVGALEDYYAWEWGDALFVVLDPYSFTAAARGLNDNWNATLGTAQYQWLKRTLETSRAKWKFVFIHQLVGGLDRNGRGGAEAAKYYEWGGNNAGGSYGFAAERPNWSLPIHQSLAAHRVAAVFHGHDHLFVRQELDGIVYQEVPQPSSARFDAANSAKEYGYVMGEVRPSPGHLRVTVSPTTVTIEYVRSYLPQDENARHSNGQVDFAYSLTLR